MEYLLDIICVYIWKQLDINGTWKTGFINLIFISGPLFDMLRDRYYVKDMNEFHPK